VGDVLEYAFTTRGANPALAGHYSTRFVVQGVTPVDRQLFRVLWEARKPLQQRQHLAAGRPMVLVAGSGTEYSWSHTNLSAIPYEDFRPPACEPYPFVELSDFSSWGEVVNWAVPLYAANPPILPPEMLELVGGWKSAAPSDEEKARLALEFVQDSVRYTGLELGPDSYRPADPVETFQKRFGDCKGKVVLLQLLLRQMGIESHPALVNTAVREAIENRLPSPFAFNHVILKIRLNDRVIWVDPTISQQGGTLAERYLPAYGKALVVRPGNAALENVPRSRPEVASQRKTVSTFHIKDYQQPVGFLNRTEYRGASADGIRDEIAGCTVEEVTKSYLNYFARQYPGITTNTPLKIADNRLANLVTIEESYIISNLWVMDEKDSLRKASFQSDNLFNSLTDPKTRLRQSPLAISFPMLRQQEIIIHLPDTNWNLPSSQTNIEHAAFSFAYRSRLNGSVWRLNYDLRTKQAAIGADQVPGYLDSLERMENLLSKALQRPDRETVVGINWLMVVLALFAAGTTAVVGGWYWWHTRPKDSTLPPALSAGPHLQGLGGWLILVAIGLCFAPFVRIFSIASNWEGYFSLQVWQTFAMPQGENYHALYGPLLMVELMGNIALFGINLLALVLFFRRRRAFPGVFITMAIANALFLILDDVGCALIPFLSSTPDGKNHSDVMRAVIHAIIWSLYMVKSRRVEATFIR
jgi:hypothetical protein